MAMTSGERSRKQRERIKAEGGRIVQVTLDKDAVAILEGVAERVGMTLSEIVAEAVQVYWEKLLETPEQ